MSIVNIHAFFDYFTKFLDLLNSLLIPFFHFFDNFERSMLFAKHSVSFIPFLPFNFHAIIISSRTFNMKANDTS